MRVLKYKGIPARSRRHRGLTGEARQYVESVSSSMFQTSGVSEYAASSTKPAGLQSGRAYGSSPISKTATSAILRTTAQSYLALGLALIRAQRAVAEVDPSALVIFTDPRRPPRRSDGRTSTFPTRACGSCGSGQRAAHHPRGQDGEFGRDGERRDHHPRRVPRGMDCRHQGTQWSSNGAPSSDRAADVGHAPRWDCPAPGAFFPPGLLSSSRLQHYCQGELDGVSEEHLELVRQYIQMCIDQEPKATPPPGLALLNLPPRPMAHLSPDAGVPVPPPEMMQ